MSRRARGSAPPCRWSRSVASHGSPRLSSTTSSSVHAIRSGRHGSAAGSSPEPAATASASNARGEGKRTLAQTPSRRPGEAPSPLESRCATQRSTPRVGTATSSGANGSGSGSARSARSASTRPSARSARWRCSIVTIHPMSRSGPSGPDSLIEGMPGAPFEDEVVVVRLRWSSDETGFAVIDADRDGDEVVLVGTLAHLEPRERVRVRGTWQEDRRFGLQVRVAGRRAARAVGRRRAARLPQARPARRRGPRAQAARPLRRGRARGDRPRPARRVPLGGAEPAADHGGRPLLGRACARPARCTSCSPRTGSRGSCRGSRRSTASARTPSCASGPTTSPACSASASPRRTRSPVPPASPPTPPRAPARPSCTCWPRRSARARPACRCPSSPARPRRCWASPPDAALLQRDGRGARPGARARRRGGLGLPAGRPRRWRPSSRRRSRPCSARSPSSSCPASRRPPTSSPRRSRPPRSAPRSPRASRSSRAARARARRRRSS